MIINLKQLPEKAIFTILILATITTPILFSTQNTELFEVPKMIFVYFTATLLFAFTAARLIITDKLIILKNPIVYILLGWLAVQIVSTLFSIDKYTSVFGYPSRLNGGLLSGFAYTAIFLTAVVSVTKKQVTQLILAFVITAFAVSLWGIPSHFGKDPNCLILTGNLTSSCWQKDFDPTQRIFSTLGQPNWLASYLILAFPFALMLAYKFKNPTTRMLYILVSFTIILALIFTSSLSGLLGLATTIIVFLALERKRVLKINLKVASVVILISLVFLSVFSKAIFSRFTQVLEKSTEALTRNSVTAVETPANEGTPSFLIRLIVWQGAIDIVKKYPLIGSGPETFAYSYYQSRPASHNQTSEWNFFYNKAHNEVLNNFANTGILGGSFYLIFVFTTVIHFFRNRGKTKSGQMYSSAAISAILGYFVSIIFGFSTVTTQLMLFLIIAYTIAAQDNVGKKEVLVHLFKKPLSQTTSLIFASLFSMYLLIFVGRIYLADVLYQRAKEKSSSPSAISIYSSAQQISPSKNPFLLSDSAYSSALIAINSEDRDLAQTLASRAIGQASLAVNISPQNLIVARRNANTYLLLSSLNEAYKEEALEAALKLPSLAPTDPQSYLTLAKVQLGLEMNKDARVSLKKALDLKPDYLEAQELLLQLESLEFDN